MPLNNVGANNEKYRPLRIVLSYVLFGFLWISFSDEITFGQYHNTLVLETIAISKGFLFIIVTGMVLYFFIKRGYTNLNSIINKSAESEKTFKIIFYGNPIPTILLNKHSQIILNLNDAAVKQYDYLPQELIGSNLKSIFADANIFQSLQKDKLWYSVLAGEHLHIRKDKSTFEANLRHELISVQDQEVVLLMISDISSEIKTRELLIQRERRYKLVTQLTSDFIFSCVRTSESVFEVDWISDNFFTMTGYTKADYDLHKSWDFILQPDSLKQFNEMISKLEKGKSFSTELRFSNKYNDSGWLNVRVYYSDEIGENIYGAARDITERLMSRLKVFESEKKLSLLFDKTKDAVFIIDMISRTYVDCNLAAEVLTGRTKDELSGTLIQTVSKENADSRMKELTHNIESARDFGEVEYTRPDGTKRIALLEAIRIDDRYAFGIAKDMTEYVTAIKSLKESEMFLSKSQVVANIGSFVFYIPENYYVSSKVMDTMFGLHGDERKSLEFWLTCIHPDDKQMMLDHVSIDVFIKHELFNKEYRIIRKSDSAVRWVWGMAEVEFSSVGAPLKMIGTIQDITARKTLEQNLILAKEEAEEMNRLKSSFFANMSHELRTPLNGILGFSELLIEEATQDEQRIKAETIHRSGKRLLNTLNLILNLSKVEANKQELRIHLVDVCELISSAVKLYQPAAIKKQIRLNFICEAGEVLLSSDQQMLDSIMNNLISNAVKYTNMGEVTVRLYIDTDGGDESCVIKVQDTGIGIPDNQQKFVFDAFRQASEGYSRAFEGTGLGLSITKKYLDLLGGSVAIESELGKGSTFTVTLPFDSSQKGMHVTLISETDITPSEQRKHFSGIFIDDDIVAFEVAEIMLKDIISIVHAETAQAGLDLLHQIDFDIAFIDINLGKGINGVDILNQISHKIHYQNIPIIAITAYAMNGDKEYFISKGFTKYISKPFSKHDLVSIVKESLKVV